MWQHRLTSSTADLRCCDCCDVLAVISLLWCLSISQVWCRDLISHHSHLPSGNYFEEHLEILSRTALESRCLPCDTVQARCVMHSTSGCPSVNLSALCWRSSRLCHLTSPVAIPLQISHNRRGCKIVMVSPLAASFVKYRGYEKFPLLDLPPWSSPVCAECDNTCTVVWSHHWSAPGRTLIVSSRKNTFLTGRAHLPLSSQDGSAVSCQQPALDWWGWKRCSDSCSGSRQWLVTLHWNSL